MWGGGGLVLHPAMPSKAVEKKVGTKAEGRKTTAKQRSIKEQGI